MRSRPVECAFEDGDRRLVLAPHRIGAAEGVLDVRILRYIVAEQAARVLELLDDRIEVALAESDLGEPGKRAPARHVAG